MSSVVRWFRTLLPLKFWLLVGAAVAAVMFSGIWVATAVNSWGGASEAAAVAGAAAVFMLMLGAFFVWRAIRAYPRERRPTQLP